MGRTITPERLKLKQDAIRIRQELGWSNRRIAAHLQVARRSIDSWMGDNSVTRVGNNTKLNLNTLHVMDCADGMAKLPHNSIDLIFADPPYNIGVSYGNGQFSLDRHRAYLAWCKRWFEAANRILKDGGSLYVMHYPEICAQWIEPLSALLQFQRWITWHYPTNVGQSSNNWTRSHRAILFFTKGDTPAYFDGLADFQAYRNPTDKRIMENLKERPGVIPYDVWNYNLVKNVSKEKTSWPNQLPMALVERIVKTSCPPEGIVCDPFMGSGTTAIVAVKNNRKWIGFDELTDSKRETDRRIGQL